MSFKYKIGFDNLTLMGEPLKEALKELYNNPFIIESWVNGSGMFHYNFKTSFGGFIQLTHETEEEQKMRFEFNPHKFTKKNEKYPMQILRLMRNPYFTRKDIAIDFYNMDMNNYVVYDLRSRKQVEYRTGQYEMETLYLGSFKSDEVTRIYNKGKEQGIDGKWWRIESQLRGDKAKMTGYNPFQKIRIVRKGELNQYEVRTRAMLYYLQTHPEALKELSTNARKKYKKMLADDITHFEFMPDLVYADEKENMILEEILWLNGSEQNSEVYFKRGKALDSIRKLKEGKWTKSDIEQVRKDIEKRV